ncbi:Rrf2 family transcriptional regulator [Schlesneria sp. DSM 10557]|uniref:RrF2 family transcriptional regulator n=1 Tax=Schlesneria sp. DSM 10557 TaxID=3044399 RepID=UPI0035A01E86
MFSQTVEYALRAVVYLADHAPNARTTDQIALATQVPKPYLSKVLQNLGRNQIVRSQRGTGGGVTLVKTPQELTILEVVNAVEPIERIHTCPLNIKSHGKQLCPLHHRMDEALGMVEKSFAQTTLAEMLAEPTGSHPLCEAAPSVPSECPSSAIAELKRQI